MPVRESHPPGTPSWIDLATSDPEAAKTFYAGVLGWTYEDMPMGDDAVYSMARVDGHNVAAIAPQQLEQADAGVPPHWQMYITTDDVDAATGRVEDAGGTVHVPPFDVFDAGRMSVLADPVGAFFMLWQPITNNGASLVNEPGAFIWAELIADEGTSTAEFYETVTGMKMLAVDMPDGTSYDGFTLDGTQETLVGGTVAPPMPGIPPNWTIYLCVADVDAAAAAVTDLGGTVMAPAFDTPVGRQAAVADPQGAAFVLFQQGGG